LARRRRRVWTAAGAWPVGAALLGRPAVVRGRRIGRVAGGAGRALRCRGRARSARSRVRAGERSPPDVGGSGAGRESPRIRWPRGFWGCDWTRLRAWQNRPLHRRVEGRVPVGAPRAPDDRRLERARSFAATRTKLGPPAARATGIALCEAPSPRSRFARRGRDRRRSVRSCFAGAAASRPPGGVGALFEGGGSEPAAEPLTDLTDADPWRAGHVSPSLKPLAGRLPGRARCSSGSARGAGWQLHGEDPRGRAPSAA